MPDYTLYYWPIAFRGQFIRAVLMEAGATWDEADFDTIAELKNKPLSEQPVPHMGPPVLIDEATGFSLSQMPAILAYLGEKHRLTPDEPQGVALTNKVIADANDVLYEMTLYNGAQMWTPESWSAFRPRLKRWMSLFEEIGRRHRMTADAGTLLGTSHPGIADLTTYVLWHTMTEKLPTLRPLLEETAPAVAGLCDRIADIPEQAALRAKTDALYGNAWCSGQIEASLRKVLGC